MVKVFNLMRLRGAATSKFKIQVIFVEYVCVCVGCEENL